MNQCPQCGKTFSEDYQFCPVDGTALRAGRPGGGRRSGRQPAQIRVRTVVLGLVLLFLCGGLAFTSAFLYQYWKPKFGGLTIKTAPPEAEVSIDGKAAGVTPLSLTDLLSGGHEIRITKEGYKDFVQQVMVIPYAFESVHWNLEPLFSQLSKDQLAEIESWRKKLDSALKENILVPPPDEYNVLYFADKILAIDPANSYASDVKTRVADLLRRPAETAYAREDWVESEKHYKNLALYFPNDTAINERLSDIAAKIESAGQNRDRMIQEFQARAETALKAGNLTPPDKDNALDAARGIQRLDKNNPYARETISRIKDLLQNRGDAKMASSDWAGARNDFRLLLQFFPEDRYTQGRLTALEAKLADNRQPETRPAEDMPQRQKAAALRKAALASFRSGAYPKSIGEWQDYLKLEPAGDEAYFYIGAAYQNQRQLDSAIQNFEKCLSINSNHALAHLNLGLLYDYHRKNFKQAEEHLLKVRELGGAEKYSPEKLQAMIQDLRERARAGSELKLAFQVEHKHAFSSCRGSLYFTEEGMEFRTEQTDHSFYETFSQMREFTLNGIALTVRTRQNKYTFSFIHPGDAEKVRVWHRGRTAPSR